MKKDVLDKLIRLKAIADTGLLYAGNDYDRERYEELNNLSIELISEATGISPTEYRMNFPLVKDYPTAKVDIRGMILSTDKKILLVQESLDKKWSLPGGWADIGFSPRETIVKEIMEETGLQATAEKLLAVFDKRLHAHPPEPLYVYKMVFYCEPVSTELAKGFDIMDVGFFDINDLPELSEQRILKSQLQLLYNKIITENWETYVD